MPRRNAIVDADIQRREHEIEAREQRSLGLAMLGRDRESRRKTHAQVRQRHHARQRSGRDRRDPPLGLAHRLQHVVRVDRRQRGAEAGPDRLEGGQEVLRRALVDRRQQLVEREIERLEQRARLHLLGQRQVHLAQRAVGIAEQGVGEREHDRLHLAVEAVERRRQVRGIEGARDRLLDRKSVV